MPHIIPIRDLKNTGEISQLCHQSKEPIYVTKNGYGDMVIMSIEMYEKQMFLSEVETKLAEAEDDVINGNVIEASEALKQLRKKHEI